MPNWKTEDIQWIIINYKPLNHRTNKRQKYYYIYIVICSIGLCVLNVCKPQEYPGLLRSFVNRKIDLVIKQNNKIKYKHKHK